MSTNTEDKTIKKDNAVLLFPELSYVVTGACFSAHNELGPYAREKQYGDAIERILREKGVVYQRELIIGSSGNVLDFLVDSSIILELKSKRILTRDDYQQAQRYLQSTGKRLALLVNFRNRYIKPVRVVRIDNYGNRNISQSHSYH